MPAIETQTIGLQKRKRGNPNLKPGPGRPKGIPNKVTTTLKEDLLKAYKELGGIEYLKKLKPDLLVRLLDRIIPREVLSDINIRGGLSFEQIVERLRQPVIESVPRRALPSPDDIVIELPKLAETGGKRPATIAQDERSGGGSILESRDLEIA